MDSSEYQTEDETISISDDAQGKLPEAEVLEEEALEDEMTDEMSEKGILVKDLSGSELSGEETDEESAFVSSGSRARSPSSPNSEEESSRHLGSEDRPTPVKGIRVCALSHRC